ncbi:MAG: PHP domain-containing protein [Firmicutes bacterium]|nr:PHP domain-containing protein [Bacillota bacterium]
MNHQTMEDLPKIDLHMHTTVSDGTDSPEAILERVREEGIRLFSVTDHDAVKAARIIPPLLGGGDPFFVTGAEFSCRDEEGKYHILGYGFDPDSAPMLELIETGHRFRMEKLMGRIEHLRQEFGIVLPEEERERLLKEDNPGKPHIGNLLTRLGYAESKDQAIREILNHIHYDGEYVRPEEAIRCILKGGGIPVLAHPTYGDGDQLILGEAMEKRLRRLTSFGLEGLEGYYSGFTARIRQEVLGFAEQFGLYVTAGSDYHGANKLVRLGDIGALASEPCAEGLLRFLERIRFHTV